MSTLSNPNTLNCAKLAERIQKLKEICDLNYGESSWNLKEIGRVAELILSQASKQLGEIKKERDDVIIVDREDSLNEFERWVREQDVFHDMRKERKRTLLEESFGINLKEIEIQGEEGEDRDQQEVTEEFVEKIKKGLEDMGRSERIEERKTTEKNTRRRKSRNTRHHSTRTPSKPAKKRASRGNLDISSSPTSPSHSRSNPSPPPTQSLLPITPSNISHSSESFISPHLHFESGPHLPLDTLKLELSLPRGTYNLDPSCRYIFYPEPSTKKLHAFCIPTGQRFVIHISHLVDNFYSELSACLLPDFSLFLSGGHSHGKVLDTCFIIDLNTMDVVYQPNMNYPRCGHCSIYLNKRVYVFGGASQTVGSLIQKSEKFKLGKKRWHSIRSLGNSRSRMSAAVYEGKIHIAGGHGAANYVVYDPIHDRYSIKGRLLLSDTPTISLFIGNRIQIIQKGVLHNLTFKGVPKVKASWVMNSEIYSLMSAEVEQDTGYFYNYDGRVYMFKAEDMPRLVCLTP